MVKEGKVGVQKLYQVKFRHAMWLHSTDNGYWIQPQHDVIYASDITRLLSQYFERFNPLTLSDVQS